PREYRSRATRRAPARPARRPVPGTRDLKESAHARRRGTGRAHPDHRRRPPVCGPRAPGTAHPVVPGAGGRGRRRLRADTRSARLTDPVRLPYPDGTFDAVVGSGVLEHTAMDGESLKELYRVLRTGGLLVVTFLPYAYSWDEWYRRNVAKAGYHRRLYTRRG